MANIELVTSHQGTPHITTDQVKDLIAGLSGDITGIKVFMNLDDAFSFDVMDAVTVRIKTGQGLAAGFHFQLLDPFDWVLDPGVVGYSRIDSLYLVIYEDPMTQVQSADFVYVVGNLYQNGTAGNPPAPPSGTNIKQEFEFMRAESSDGAIVQVVGYFYSYLSNQDLETSVSNLVYQLERDVGGTVAQVRENTESLGGVRFGIDQNGVRGYYKEGDRVITPFRNPTGNAAQSDVLVGKTFSSASQENVAGTMYDNGAVNQNLSPGGSYTVPRGFHNGNGKVNAKVNTDTYSFQAGDNGNTKDMGQYNLNRYVNAANVREYGRSEKSVHTITCMIYGATNQGFKLEVMVDGQPVFPPVTAAGQIGEMGGAGSGIYTCQLQGSFVGLTSYNGGLSYA